MTTQHPHTPPQHYGPYYPAPQPSPRNGFGITALCLAVPGLLFGLVPLTGFIAVILGVLAMIFGCVGWGRAQRGVATNKAMSITGTVLGAVAITAGIIGIAIVVQAVDDFDKDMQQIEEDLNQGSTPGSGDRDGAQDEPPAEDNGPASTVNDGTHLVGEDIEPGEYTTDGPDPDSVIPMCYWSRNSDSSGEFDAIIANGTTEGPARLTVNDGEYLELSGGCEWDLN